MPEIMAGDLEIVDAEPIPGTAVAHRAASPVQTADLFGVVASYAERGIAFPIESLERLIALQERAQERNARDAYFRALASFQEEVPPLRRTKDVDYVTRDGQRVQYSYSPLGEIARVIRPILPRHGLSYSWDSAFEGERLNVTCTLRHIDGHAETGSFACPIDTAAKMSGPQRVGAALTYARRQSLVQVCGLSNAEDDVDGLDQQATSETVTEEQVDILRGLLIRSGSDESKFLRLMGVGVITELPAARFDAARTALEDKLGKMEARAREKAAS